jgi:diguanylate cyclase (GGDEF)-like protein/PAS domain S-box-containing protein
VDRAVTVGLRRLALTETDFRLIAEGIPQMAWISAGDGSSEFANHQATAYLGTQQHGAHRSDLRTATHPDDADDASRKWDHALRTLTPLEVQARVRRFDGQYRWHAIRARPFRDERGVVLRWITTAVDIDDVRMLEESLRAAERRTAETVALLETLQAHAPVGFGFVDRDFRRVLVNDQLAEYNGSTVAEQIGQLVSDLVPAFWPQLEPLYRSVLETGQPVLDVEVAGPSALDPSQTRYWVNSYYPVTLDDQVAGVGIVAVEITGRKTAELAYQQMAAVVEYSGEATFGATSDGTITSWNAAATRLFGYISEEVIGQPVGLLAPAELLHEQEEIRLRINAGGPVERLETRRRRKDGSIVEVLITSSPVNDEAGAVVGRSVTVQDMTERAAAQRALQNTQRQLVEAQQIAQVGSFELDLLTGDMFRSDQHYAILGIDRARRPSPELFLSAVHPDDRPMVAEAVAAATETGVAFDLVYRITRADGQLRWVNARTVPELTEHGAVIRLVGTIQDITELIESRRRQRATDVQLEIAFDQSGIGAGIIDLNGIPTRVNAAVCALLGRPKELLVGRSWSEYSHPDEIALEGPLMARMAAGHDSYSDERRFLRPDGSVVWAALHITLARDEDRVPQNYLAQLLDITERKTMEAELLHQALHDSLTGLPNRALLTDRLVHGLAGARGRRTNLGVIFLDIDNFKSVNDSLGHTAGDELLRHTVDRIAAVIRPSDTVARFGGDEFVIVCDDATLNDTEKIAERILEAVQQPCLIGDNEVSVTASLGIVAADELATPESLLRDSDTAMYVAKSLGRNRVESFRESLRGKAERHLATTSALRHALARDEFIVYYQPVIDLDTGAMVSAEALLRWDRPGHGLVSPSEFIPLAEEAGLITAIGTWALEQACQQLVEWQLTQPAMTVAVNLSVRQVLALDVVTQVEDVLTRTGPRPGSLCLELTESVFMGDVDYFAETLASLKSLGVTLSIDDFGTGYSSLSYLKRFPVDAVKIDKAFVDGLGTDPHDSALVAAIIAMADALNLAVTAEGIETQQQLAILKQLRCRRAQGFYLARPMPAVQLAQLIQQGHHWSVN